MERLLSARRRSLRTRRRFARRLDTCFPTIRNPVFVDRLSRSACITYPCTVAECVPVFFFFPVQNRRSSLAAGTFLAKKPHDAPESPYRIYIFIQVNRLYEISFCTLDFFFLSIVSLKKGKSNVRVYKKSEISLSPRGRRSTACVRFLPAADSPLYLSLYHVCVCLCVCVHACTCVERVC